MSSNAPTTNHFRQPLTVNTAAPVGQARTGILPSPSSAVNGQSLLSGGYQQQQSQNLHSTGTGHVGFQSLSDMRSQGGQSIPRGYHVPVTHQPAQSHVPASISHSQHQPNANSPTASSNQFHPPSMPQPHQHAHHQQQRQSIPLFDNRPRVPQFTQGLSHNGHPIMPAQNGGYIYYPQPSPTSQQPNNTPFAQPTLNQIGLIQQGHFPPPQRRASHPDANHGPNASIPRQSTLPPVWHPQSQPSSLPPPPLHPPAKYLPFPASSPSTNQQPANGGAIHPRSSQSFVPIAPAPNPTSRPPSTSTSATSPSPNLNSTPAPVPSSSSSSSHSRPPTSANSNSSPSEPPTPSTPNPDSDKASSASRPDPIVLTIEKHVQGVLAPGKALLERSWHAILEGITTDYLRTFQDHVFLQEKYGKLLVGSRQLFDRYNKLESERDSLKAELVKSKDEEGRLKTENERLDEEVSKQKWENENLRLYIGNQTKEILGLKDVISTSMPKGDSGKPAVGGGGGGQNGDGQPGDRPSNQDGEAPDPASPTKAPDYPPELVEAIRKQVSLGVEVQVATILADAHAQRAARVDAEKKLEVIQKQLQMMTASFNGAQASPISPSICSETPQPNPAAQSHPPSSPLVAHSGPSSPIPPSVRPRSRSHTADTTTVVGSPPPTSTSPSSSKIVSLPPTSPPVASAINPHPEAHTQIPPSSSTSIKREEVELCLGPEVMADLRRRDSGAENEVIDLTDLLDSPPPSRLALPPERRVEVQPPQLPVTVSGRIGGIVGQESLRRPREEEIEEPSPRKRRRTSPLPLTPPLTEEDTFGDPGILLNEARSSSSATATSNNSEAPPDQESREGAQEDVPMKSETLEPEPPDPLHQLSASKPKLGFKHIDLVYHQGKDRMICRLCILRRKTEPTAPTTWFPLTASYDRLIEHCETEHPPFCEAVYPMSSAQLGELRQQLLAYEPK
ncbi:hypothetical protein JAAARDRAFT_210810 [Jaapia argillacea MUCL 33604]|uniref:Uncharacterized protein n=1 Tax=Jaapia argillacea MUCL 33604 TaxID=933084 RepID=A0A067PNZ3_9AGAM|nr:hypothetical protein JAAARDRAFT_210810 [Jaapia argillacea MUCL 33604]